MPWIIGVHQLEYQDNELQHCITAYFPKRIRPKCKLTLSYQRRLWQLGTGQADYRSHSTPKKEITTKLLEYTQK